MAYPESMKIYGNVSCIVMEVLNPKVCYYAFENDCSSGECHVFPILRMLHQSPQEQWPKNFQGKSFTRIAEQLFGGYTYPNYKMGYDKVLRKVAPDAISNYLDNKKYPIFSNSIPFSKEHGFLETCEAAPYVNVAEGPIPLRRTAMGRVSKGSKVYQSMPRSIPKDAAKWYHYVLDTYGNGRWNHSLREEDICTMAMNDLKAKYFGSNSEKKR